MLHHGLERNELQDGANGIRRVRYAVSEDTHCLFQLLRIRVLDARIPDLWPVEDATKGLLRNGDVVSQRAGHDTEAKPSHKEEMTHVVYSFPSSRRESALRGFPRHSGQSDQSTTESVRREIGRAHVLTPVTQ